ncbi:hypothetical protein Sjap_025636 [Stephania japonica]|uniref:Pentatricopeptide repeat-containing protein n=1 Tax=Stephania japonica TaxID=461633 RepID=A0AAP0E1Z8_9MAGN
MQLVQLRRISSTTVSSLSTSLNLSLNHHIRNGRIADARKLFDRSQEHRDVATWNTMISGYCKNGQIKNAQHLFDEMPQRDVITWNTMLGGFYRSNDMENLVGCFLEMGRTGVKPTEFTLASVISAVSETGFGVLVPQLHGNAVCLGLNSSVFVGSALIGGYTSLGGCLRSDDLRQVFDEILAKDVTSWNALISGYMSVGDVAEACRMFGKMPERNVVSWTCLVQGYIQNKKMDDARRGFDKMPEKNVVSWTVMISGYERNGRFEEALELFVLMLNSGVQPNEFTLSSVASACAGSSFLVFGRQVHSSILKTGVPTDVLLLSSLVDMYAKCGDITAAESVFETIPEKSLPSWNSIVGGYAKHCYGTRTLELFERMKRHGIKPDNITLVHVLTACAHGGLVEEGEAHFESMVGKFGIQPEKEHFACMVDLYGRAGELEKAKNLIKRIPFEPDIVVWGALLGACGLHSNLEFGLFAAEEMYKLERDHPAAYSLLSKIHGDKGEWARVVELRKMMEVGTKKQKAGSWIGA